MTDETEGQVTEDEEAETEGNGDAPPPPPPPPAESDGKPTQARAVLEHRARLKAMDERMAK